MTIKERIADLYGTNFFETFIKDYNGQTTWASFNIKAFMSPEQKAKSPIPDWLNIAVGYGGDNMFGGFANEWNADGEDFLVDANGGCAFRLIRMFGVLGEGPQSPFSGSGVY